jgi:hypothetical protein
VQNRFAKAAGFATLWLASASVTVSFVGAELYGMFTARGAAQAVFEAERSRVQAQARQLQQWLQSAALAAAQFSEHAQAMAKLEAEPRGGGSCMVNRGGGEGKVHAFRRTDATAAQQLTQQVQPQAQAAQAALQVAQDLRFGADAPVLLEKLGQAVASLNAVSAAPLWGQLAEFAKSLGEAGQNIRTAAGTFQCDDAARALKLKELERAATAIAKLPPLAAPRLMDPKDMRDITLATLVRTGSTYLGLLPTSWFAGRPLVDTDLRARYGLKDKPAVLSNDSLPLALAWGLELVLVCLLVLTGHARPEHEGKRG